MNGFRTPRYHAALRFALPQSHAELVDRLSLGVPLSPDRSGMRHDELDCDAMAKRPTRGKVNHYPIPNREIPDPRAQDPLRLALQPVESETMVVHYSGRMRPRHGVRHMKVIRGRVEHDDQHASVALRQVFQVSWGSDMPVDDREGDGLAAGQPRAAEKTSIVHVEKGFNFLGWNVRKDNGTLLIKPTKMNVRAFLAKVRGTINESFGLSPGNW